jgi:hypothetical protein
MLVAKRPVSILFGVSALVLCALLSACSDPLAYTIINETDHDLMAWGFNESCESVTGYRDDYHGVLVIPARETAEYYETWGNGSDTDCIQIVDQSRRLILSIPYEQGGENRHIVNSWRPSGPIIPEFDEMPEQPWLDSLIEDSRDEPLFVAYLGVILAFGLVMIVALPYGVYRAVRDLLSYRRRPSP